MTVPDSGSATNAFADHRVHSERFYGKEKTHVPGILLCSSQKSLGTDKTVVHKRAHGDKYKSNYFIFCSLCALRGSLHFPGLNALRKSLPLSVRAAAAALIFPAMSRQQRRAIPGFNCCKKHSSPAKFNSLTIP